MPLDLADLDTGSRLPFGPFTPAATADSEGLLFRAKRLMQKLIRDERG